MEPARNHVTMKAPPAEPARLVLLARFMLPDMSEHACRATSITPGGALFLTPLILPPGLAVISYIEEIGRFEGETGERQDDGLRMTFRVSGLRRERMEARLRWLAESEPPQDGAQRRHPRFAPHDPSARITLPNGRHYPCKIIDISLSGAAIRIDLKPDHGSHLFLGMTRGRVVRHLKDGVAIEFVRQLNPQQLRTAIA